MEEHAREVSPQVPVKPPDDAEVQIRHGSVVRHEDISGVHVRVKNPVIEDLLKEEFYPVNGYLFYIEPLGFYRLDLVERHAFYALHSEYFGKRAVPVNLRHLDARVVLEQPSEESGVR